MKENANPGDRLDALDRAILNRIQKAVPLARRPFEIIASELNTTEDNVIERVRRMWDLGIVRRLGPIVDYASWGMAGVLVAAKGDEAAVERARRVVHDYPEITHAYLRDHSWNIWFTVIAQDETTRDAIIDRVAKRAGLTEVKPLPQKAAYKLGVKFEL